MKPIAAIHLLQRALRARLFARAEGTVADTAALRPPAWRRHHAGPSSEGAAWAVSLALVLALLSGAAQARHGELPNRIPEPPPYDTKEALANPPPWDQYFDAAGPHVCAVCHREIFDQWNGSMMANSWRDPVWRGAFFLIARLTATDGNCDIPAPPDGTAKSKINPFANGDCSSTFDLGTAKHTTHGSGSLLDGFCSRCHMPANYIEAIQPKNVSVDPDTGIEHGLVDSNFDPTSARTTDYAFATVAEEARNSEAGKLGITCTFCHTIADTRYTPFHNYLKSGDEYSPALGQGTRADQLPPELQEYFTPRDAESPNLGYAVGTGAYRISPQALVQSERFGPLTGGTPRAGADPYVSQVFGQTLAYQTGQLKESIHRGNYHVLFERAELCGTCHDVTNPLTIKNPAGKWVGGFPIERTYSEWASSRYADRPGNKNFNPDFKRDCQTCHMQQHFGRAGTAQALYDEEGKPLPPLNGKAARQGPERPVFYSHHFIGGNTFSTRLVGANADLKGKANPYPELSKYSYSSADPNSPYYNAYFEGADDTGPPTYHPRMAWDRLRNALEIELNAPDESPAGGTAKLDIKVKNTGTGHNFPTGFPEGRNAWVAVRAFDVASGQELTIEDSRWKRQSVGVGYLTAEDSKDPNFPKCKWKVPAGSPDPYAWQFRAVASFGDGCPTLYLPYATPLNLVVNDQGLPIDTEGKVIGRDNSLPSPRFKDVDGDGDLYDDAFLLDTRLRPMPHPAASLELDRYSVLVPDGIEGPVAVTVAIYYQSMEAVVAKKLLGNLADTDLDHVLEPCVLRGPCDGRIPRSEPAVVEGAPPVPIRVESAVIKVQNRADEVAPRIAVYPDRFAANVPNDVVVKFTASEPVRGINEDTFTLLDETGASIGAAVAQIDDYTYALFPDPILLDPGRSYYAEIAGPICDFNDNCIDRSISWSFRIASDPELAIADTRSPPVPPAPTGPPPSN